MGTPMKPNTERFECQACGGVYQCPDARGMIYFHVCPPVWSKSTGDQHRDGHRDENLTVLEGPGAPIRAEGKGVKCLSNTKLREPVWMTVHKLKLAKEKAESDDSPSDD